MWCSQEQSHDSTHSFKKTGTQTTCCKIVSSNLSYFKTRWHFCDSDIGIEDSSVENIMRDCPFVIVKTVVLRKRRPIYYSEEDDDGDDDDEEEEDEDEENEEGATSNSSSTI